MAMEDACRDDFLAIGRAIVGVGVEQHAAGPVALPFSLQDAAVDAALTTGFDEAVVGDVVAHRSTSREAHDETPPLCHRPRSADVSGRRRTRCRGARRPGDLGVHISLAPTW